MLFQMIKKDLLMLIRNPRLLITLLVMPFVLISILGTALATVNTDKQPPIKLNVAVIQSDEPKQAEEKITKELQGLPIPEEGKQTMINGMKAFSPANVLVDDVLQSKELKKFIKIERIKSWDDIKDQQKYSSIIEIPKDFTYEYYHHIFFRDQKRPELSLKLNEAETMESEILQDIVGYFQEQVSFWNAVQTTNPTINMKLIQEKLKEQLGKTETINKKKEVTFVGYYAIGMSIMFMFYVATAIAGFAVIQKEDRIFDRIVLADVPVLTFFSGIFCSSFLVSFLQMNILFGLSALIFKVYWPNLISYLVVVIMLSLMIGGFAILLSALSYIGTKNVAEEIGSFIVPILAFAGGSFFPVAQFGEQFAKVSSYTPAGAGVSALMKIAQDYPLTNVTSELLALFITTILMVVIAIIILPKRGGAV